MAVQSTPKKLLFLPGATGNTAFWQPVSELLQNPAERVHATYPGFGTTPADSNVDGIEKIAANIAATIEQPTAIIAQSMGGVIAVLIALEKPNLISHLVLSVTSGGIDLDGLGAQDWRPDFVRSNPGAPAWMSDFKRDLSSRIRLIQVPTLLIWGDDDPISPVAVGERLVDLLPNATLQVLPNGKHDLGYALAKEVAPLIDAHLSTSAYRGR